MELRVRHIARNVLSNWFGAIANMAVGFFLAPFILHRLGNVAYGVWVLAVSVVAYMGLLDLGMQSSVLRFVSKGHTKGDHQSASDAISAALWVRLQMSALILLLSSGLAAAFPAMFKVPVDLASDARKAILLIGLTAAISMSIGVAGAVLSALNRYDLQNFVSLTQTAVRVIGVVGVLRSGHGIVAIAICELVAVSVGNILLVWVARWLYPEIQVQLKKPKREILRALWTYSTYAFLTSVALQLVYQTDNLVVGAFISASAVTFYAIANSLCRYAGLVVSSMALTFVPAASNYEAAGNSQALRALYIHGTRMTMALFLPIFIILTTRGHTFIGVWMGPEYAHVSGDILIILATSLFFALANRIAVSIAFGIEKHKQGAIWAIGEGVANLVLSVALVKPFGIYGVAIGTLIPSLFVQIVLWPRYVYQLVGVRVSEIVFRVWGPICLASIPFAAVSYAIDRLITTQKILAFILQTFASLPIFLIGAALVFRQDIRSYIMPRVKSFLFAGVK